MSRASVRLLLLALVAAALFVLIRHPGSVNRDRPSEGEPVAVRWPAGRPEPGELPAGPGELRWDPPGLTSLLPGPPPFVNRLGLPLETQVFPLAFSPDGKRLITRDTPGPHRQGGGQHLWDVENRRLIGSLALHDPAFSPDGSVIAGTAPPWFQFLDAATGRVDDQASVPGEVIGRPDFSPDGKRVILGGFDMFVYDAGAQTLTRFEPEDPWRASRQRPVRDPRRLVPSPFEGYVSPRWSPDGKRVAAITYPGGDTCVWEAATGEILHRLPPGSGRWPYRVVFWPDGRRLTTVSGDGVLKVWDLTAIDFRKPSPVMSVETSGESHIADGGPRLAWLRWSQADRWAADTVVVADLAGRELRAIRLPGQASRQVVLSGDGRRLAVVGHSDRAVRLYDTDTGERVGLVHDTASPVVHVAYRDGGKVLRVTLADGSLREWDPAARAPLRSARVALPEGDPARRLPLLLPGERPRVSPFALPGGEYRVAISADGRLWATATADGRCRVWDTATGRPRFEPAERLHVPKPPPSGPFPQVNPDPRLAEAAFADGGKYLVGRTGDGLTLTVWDLAAGRTAHAVALPAVPTSFALAADDRTLFVGSHARPRFAPDGENVVLRVWDLSAGRVVWSLDALPRVPDPPEVVGQYATVPGGSAVVAVHCLGGDAVAVTEVQYSWPAVQPPRRWEPPPQPWETARRLRVVPRAADRPERVVAVPIGPLGFSADGRWVVAAPGQTVQLHDVPAGRGYAAGTRPFWLGYTTGTSVAFRPDGGQFAAGGADGTVTLFDVAELLRPPDDAR